MIRHADTDGMPAAGSSDRPVAIRRVGFREVIAVAGRFDEVAASAVADAFFNAIEQGAQELWLDLSGVTALDGGAAEAITRLLAFGHEVERRVLVVCPAGPARRSLAEAGVDDDTEIYDSLSAAQRAR